MKTVIASFFIMTLSTFASVAQADLPKPGQSITCQQAASKVSSGGQIVLSNLDGKNYFLPANKLTLEKSISLSYALSVKFKQGGFLRDSASYEIDLNANGTGKTVENYSGVETGSGHVEHDITACSEPFTTPVDQQSLPPAQTQNDAPASNQSIN